MGKLSEYSGMIVVRIISEMLRIYPDTIREWNNPKRRLALFVALLIAAVAVTTSIYVYKWTEEGGAHWPKHETIVWSEAEHRVLLGELSEGGVKRISVTPSGAMGSDFPMVIKYRAFDANISVGDRVGVVVLALCAFGAVVIMPWFTIAPLFWSDREWECN